MLAWALDGVAPSKLGEVSERRHSPLWAIALLTFLALGALAAYAFTTWFAVLSGLLAFAITFFIVSLLGIVFPFWKKDVFEASPAALRVAGVPLMTIGGVIGTVFTAFIIYRSVVDKFYGNNTSVSLWSVLGTFVVAFGLYLGVTWSRRRRGVLVESRFKEIPVE